jgi:hypothetical protein
MFAALCENQCTQLRAIYMTLYSARIGAGAFLQSLHQPARSLTAADLTALIISG